MHAPTFLAAATAVLACLPTTFSSPTTSVEAKPAAKKARSTNYTMTKFSFNATDGGNQGILYNVQIGFVDQTCNLVNVRERDQISKPQIAFDCGPNKDVFAYALQGHPMRPLDSHGKSPAGTGRNLNFIYSIGDGTVQTVEIGDIFKDKNLDCSNGGNPPFTCTLKTGGFAAHLVPITSERFVCT